MAKEARIGVVLLNLGGPRGEDHIRDFLKRMLSDPDVVTIPWPMRPLLARWIARRRAPHVAAHYRSIGGRSPLDAHTREQVEALRGALGPDYAVRYAFRHSPPFAAEVVAGLAEAGVRRLVALPAYPHWSRSTTGSALADLRRAAAPLDMAIAEAPSFPAGEGYIGALAGAIEAVLSPGAHVLLSAHGLPQKMIDGGDPYVREVELTRDALVARLPAGTPLSLAYQSRLGPVEWTRPYLVDEVARLAGAGQRSLIVVPVSFVAENLETRYELDLEVADLARAAGVERYVRVPTPGSHPAFIDELARLSRATAQAAGWEAGHGS